MVAIEQRLDVVDETRSVFNIYSFYHLRIMVKMWSSIRRNWLVDACVLVCSVMGGSTMYLHMSKQYVVEAV